MGAIPVVRNNNELQLSTLITGLCTADITRYTVMPVSKCSFSQNVPEHRVKPQNLRPYTSMGKNTTQEVPLKRYYRQGYSRGPCVGQIAPGFVTETTYYTYYPSANVNLQCSPNVWLGVREKLGDSEINLSGYVGEYKETAGLLLTAAKGLKAVWDVAHLRPPSFLKGKKFSFKDVSAAWVNKQFVIKPLMSDIYDIHNEINSKRIKPDIVKIIHRDEVTVTDSRKTSDNTAMCFGTRTESQRAIIECTRNAHASHFVVDPLDALWEAIPGSFLIDWLLPVGSWISSLHATRNFGGYYGTVTTKVDEMVSVSFIDTYAKVGGGPGYVTNVGIAPYVRKVNGVSRGVVTNIPVPSFPRFTVKTNVKSVLSHLTTASALLHLMRK